MNKTQITFIVVATVSLFACSSTGGNEANIGAVAGGITGAAACSGVGGKDMDAKSRVAAMIVCGMVGALIGDRMGSYLDEEDKQIGINVLNQNSDYEGSTWFNPRTGCNITITPLPVSNPTSTGNFCRDYTAEIVVNGQFIKENHTACRQPDGSWVEG